MKPWIPTESFDAIHRKQKLYKTHFKSSDPSKIAYYKKFSNDLTTKDERSKKQFFFDELNKHKSNPKKLWEIMLLILPPSKKQNRFSEQPNKLNVEGKALKILLMSPKHLTIIL